MNSSSLAILVNLLGFIAGVWLYAMLLGMVVRETSNAPRRRFSDWLPPDRLPLVTAVLGLLWNAGALWSYGQEALTRSEPPPALMAAAFTALGFLPAVVVHSTLRLGEGKGYHPGGKLVVVLAYGLSLVAAILHVGAVALNQTEVTDGALRLSTIGFAALIVALLFVLKGQGEWRRAISIVALAVFAVSSLHLSHRSGHDTWTVELLGHHASLPLAIAILYQDYRFALIDIFLKRVLSFVALMACAFGLYVAAGTHLLEFRNEAGHSEPVAVSLFLGLCVALALIYPTLRRLVERFVDTVVLRRPDYDQVRKRIERDIASTESVTELLDVVARDLAPVLSASSIEWRPLAPDAGIGVDGQIDSSAFTRIVATAEAPRFAVDIGPLVGGRRLLSDDAALIDAVLVMAARRIDAVRVAHERCTADLRQQEISKLATEAELRALQAQLNPHFLFNALTTIGYLIQTSPERALDTLMRLTGLLRAVLKRSTGEFTTLGDEIDLVESYLSIERARFEERLRVRMDVPPHLHTVRIPPLLVQPLVENAIKHGIGPSRSGGDLVVSATVDGIESAHNGMVHISVRDTGVGVSELDLARGRKLGVGLANIRQRLECYFGTSAVLEIRSEPGAGTVVDVWVPAVHTQPSVDAQSEQARRGA